MPSKINSKLSRLKSHQGFMRYAKNTSWLMAEKILRMFVSLFIGVWVARYLGPEQYGLFSYAQSFVFLFAAIATLGLDSIVIREIVKDQSRVNELLGTAFVMKLLGAIIILPIIWIALQASNNDSYTKTIIFIIASSAIFNSFNVVDFFFQAKVLSKYTSISKSIGMALTSVVKIILILLNAPLIAFVFMVLIDVIISSIGLIIFYKIKSNYQISNWRFNKILAISLLKDSWPLIMSSIMIALYMRIDQIMIKEMLSIGDVGQYAVAVKLSEVWYFIPMAICNSVFPAIINARRTNEVIYYARLQRLYSFLVWLGIIIASAFTLCSGFIVTLLFGQSYIQASQILVIHIWTGIFVGLGVASGKWIYAENITIISIQRTLLGLLVNVFFNWFLIPRIGVIGAALGSLYAQVFAAYIYDLLDKRMERNFMLKTKAFIGIGLFAMPYKK